MSENSTVANLVATRGNRCTASILTWLEANVYPHIPAELRPQVRQQVIDQVNGFKDLAIDIVKSETAMINEEYVKVLADIHRELKRISNGSKG